MQRWKHLFEDKSHVETFSNIQSCIRCNDIEEIGDGTHLLYFNMIGFFSFREYTLKETIDFWFEFLQLLEVKIDYVTIHPDKIEEWKTFYNYHDVEIREDFECTWSDGNIGGYCTEFYVNDIEIGNIVNTNGDCIDVGFGLERLCLIVDESFTIDKTTTIKESIFKVINSGYKPGPNQQGYVLRKLLGLLYRSGETIDHPFFEREVARQQRMIERYHKLKEKHHDKSPEWWYDTHGVVIEEIE